MARAADPARRRPRTGALIVIERETGLEEIAETGVMIHGDLSSDLLEALFIPRGALHDGAVIIRGETILAAGALLPLAETTLQAERYGTRHRAALGITERPTRSSSSSPRRPARRASSNAPASAATSTRRQLTRAITALLRPRPVAASAIRDRLTPRARG